MLDLERINPHAVAVTPLEPVQELREAIELVVMPCLWKLEQLKTEFFKPLGPSWQMYLPGFYFCGLGMHSANLVPFWGEGNRMWNVSCFSLQLLNQGNPRTFVLNNDRIRPKPEGKVK
jgi:hypothetical protein